MVKFSNVRNVWPDVMNPSFEFLEHFHVDFGVDGFTAKYKLMVDKPLNVEEHNEHGLDFLLIYSDFLRTRYADVCHSALWCVISKSYSNT